jgi:hypothetical protein
MILNTGGPWRIQDFSFPSRSNGLHQCWLATLPTFPKGFFFFFVRKTGFPLQAATSNFYHRFDMDFESWSHGWALFKLRLLCLQLLGLKD